MLTGLRYALGTPPLHPTRQVLNLDESHTGEQLVQAKNSAVSRGSDVTLVRVCYLAPPLTTHLLESNTHALTYPLVSLQVDAAYDAVLQQSFSKRRTGAGVKLEVKYADVRLASPQTGKLKAAAGSGAAGRGGGPGGRGSAASGAVSGEQVAQKLAAAVPRVQVPRKAAEVTMLGALFAAAGLATLAAGAMHVPVRVHSLVGGIVQANSQR